MPIAATLADQVHHFLDRRDSLLGAGLWEDSTVGGLTDLDLGLSGVKQIDNDLIVDFKVMAFDIELHIDYDVLNLWEISLAQPWGATPLLILDLQDLLKKVLKASREKTSLTLHFPILCRIELALNGVSLPGARLAIGKD